MNDQNTEDMGENNRERKSTCDLFLNRKWVIYMPNCNELTTMEAGRQNLFLKH